MQIVFIILIQQENVLVMIDFEFEVFEIKRKTLTIPSFILQIISLFQFFYQINFLMRIETCC
jgi:hypothetical protein